MCKIGFCIIAISLLILNGCTEEKSIIINNDKTSINDCQTSKFISVCSGDEHNLILREDGTVFGFGDNRFGQIGDGSRKIKYRPVQVNGLENIVDINAGVYHSLALKKDGSVWSWGSNAMGQLGNGTKVDSDIPVMVQGLTDIVQIDANGYSSLALKEDGTVWAWGDNSYMQLGSNSIDSTIPQKIKGIENVISIGCGGSNNTIVKSDGSVWAWGWNKYVNLCVGSDEKIVKSPKQVIGITDINTISASTKGIIALSNNAFVWEWGHVEKPIQIKDLKKVKEIYQAGFHSLAIKEDGTLWGWGSNTDGQIGNGSQDNKYYVPVTQVSNISNIIEVSGGIYHSVAIDENGNVWTWGNNRNGQLGHEEIEYSLKPIKLSF